MIVQTMFIKQRLMKRVFSRQKIDNIEIISNQDIKTNLKIPVKHKNRLLNI